MGQTQSSHRSAEQKNNAGRFLEDINMSSAEGANASVPDIKLPVKKRSCTDIVCCAIFIVCILLLIVVAVFSYVVGDFRRMVFPKDSQGKICGLAYPDRKRLYFFDMLSCLNLPEVVIQYGCPTKQICVSKCPNYTWTAQEGDSFDSRSRMICEGGVNGNFETYKLKSIEELIGKKICAPKISPTETLFGRCVPSAIVSAIDDRNRRILTDPSSQQVPLSLPSIVLGARTVVTRIIEDLVRSWKVILICLILAALVSFLWIVLLRLCTCFMVAFTLMIFVGVFGLATGFCFWRYAEIKRIITNPPPFAFTLDITSYFSHSTTWLVLGVISALILLLVLLIILFLRKRIALANRVIGEASKAVEHLPATLFWPIIPFVLITGVIALWLFVDLNLRSVVVSEGVYFDNSTVEPRSKYSKEWSKWIMDSAIKCDPTANNTEGRICLFVKQITNRYMPWLQVYNFAMCVWLINFFIALDQITLAGTFATFYFCSQGRRGSTVGCCGVWTLLVTCGSALLYNTGSLALGSLVITLFWLLRVCLLRIERKLKLANNELAKFFLRCLCCCLWCLEKFLRFLNKNAYIMMAIYGRGFCRSAKDAFGLIMRNVVRVFVVEKVTDFILFVGKLVVSAAAACVAYVYLSGLISDHFDIVPEPKLHLNYIIVPISVIVLGSYLIAKAFFSVFEMGVDTIFICVCEDLERNDGTAEKPYFMSTSTMKMLKKPDAESATS